GPEWLALARTHGLLSRLPAEIVSAVVAGAYRVEYPAGAVALRWDDSPKAGVVLRGTLRAYIALPDGGQVTTRYLAAGDMTGVFAPRQPQITRAVQALEPCELLFIDAELDEEELARFQRLDGPGTVRAPLHRRGPDEGDVAGDEEE